MAEAGNQADLDRSVPTLNTTGELLLPPPP
jgi:hypothetical protein